MRNVPLFSFWLLTCLAAAAAAQEQAPPVARPSVAAPLPPTAIVTKSAASTQAAPDSELVNQVLALLGDAIITHLDARVSLEALEVQEGRLRLSGVSIKNLDLGVRLSPKNVQRLAHNLRRRTQWATSERNRQLAQLLEILKLGLFNRLEVSIRLDELTVRQIELDAVGLQVEGLLLQVGATPPDPSTGKPRSDTLWTLMDILRRTALNEISAEAGLDHLAARQARVSLDGISLQGFSLGVLLARQDTASQQVSSSSTE